MPHICYILHSNELDRYYTGYTSKTVKDRVQRHLSGYYDNTKFTHNADDWIIFLEIKCEKACEATKIEAHIKRMKSKIYIENLKKYPEIIQKLKNRYSSCI